MYGSPSHSCYLTNAASFSAIPTFNPYKATFGITDLPKVLIERAQLTLRHVVGARKVQSVLTDRDHEAMSLEIAKIVGNIAEKWGVAIDCFLIKGVVFSPEVSAAWSAAHRKTTVESRVMTPSAEVASTDIPVSYVYFCSK
jgi:erythrocyte band 7 integral membrane protein